MHGVGAGYSRRTGQMPPLETILSMAERGDVFLREVDEDVRREQLAKLWERFGLYIVAVAVLIVVGIGGVKWWQYRQASLSEAAGERFEAAARIASSGKPEDITKAFSGIITNAPQGYSVLARMRVAGSLAASGKPAEALAEYEALAKDTAIDPILRDYASLQAAMLRVDSADAAEMQTRLAPLTTATSPWRHMAREVQALAAIKAGKTDEARKHLEALLGERTLPPTMLERVQLLLSVLTDQAAAPPAPSPSAAPPTAAPAPAVPKDAAVKAPTPEPKK